MFMIEAQRGKNELQCPNIDCENHGIVNRTKMDALEKETRCIPKKLYKVSLMSSLHMWENMIYNVILKRSLNDVFLSTVATE